MSNHTTQSNSPTRGAKRVIPETKYYTFSSGASKCVVGATSEKDARKKLEKALIYGEMKRSVAISEAKNAKIVSIH